MIYEDICGFCAIDINLWIGDTSHSQSLHMFEWKERDEFRQTMMREVNLQSPDRVCIMHIIKYPVPFRDFLTRSVKLMVMCV